MAIIKLTQLGENFIHSKINGSGNSKLSGKASDKHGSVKANPTKVLPYCSPLTTTSKIWTSNAAINGGITTNAELATALIRIYNKYAEIYQLDANIMVAQAYQESGLIVWNYAVNSSASGMVQFIDDAIFDYIISNKYGGFSDAERMAITKNVIDYTYTSSKNQPKNPFLTDYLLGQKNRPILHQNIIDNPEIMIKAQFIYMKRMSGRCDGVASCALFGYNRGPGYVKSSSYPNAIAAASKHADVGGRPYEDEGIGYVYRIFQNLYDNFGYKELNMTKEARNKFDKFNANLG